MVEKLASATTQAAVIAVNFLGDIALREIIVIFS
jgi:hypothetical protein